MKLTKAAAVTALAAAATLTVTSLAQAAPTVRPSAAPTASATASAQLAGDLRFMREEERMARDLYAALAKQYDNARPFSNITVAENRHFSAMGTLLTRYRVADPSTGLKAGDYAFDELDEHYATLLEQGRKSLAGAYAAGVAVEKEDIADLKEAIARTKEADAKAVFENLLRGSTQHLAAFERTPGTAQAPGQRRGGPGGTPGQGPGQGNGPGQGRGPGGGMRGTNPDCPLR